MGIFVRQERGEELERIENHESSTSSSFLRVQHDRLGMILLKKISLPYQNESGKSGKKL